MARQIESKVAAYHIVHWTPVQKIQIIVIQKFRRIQNALWSLRNVSEILLGWPLSCILAV